MKRRSHNFVFNISYLIRKTDYFVMKAADKFKYWQVDMHNALWKAAS